VGTGHKISIGARIARLSGVPRRFFVRCSAGAMPAASSARGVEALLVSGRELPSAPAAYRLVARVGRSDIPEERSSIYWIIPADGGIDEAG
jgi:hypothetical protein